MSIAKCLAGVLLAACLIPAVAPAREVDDSYTVGRRFDQYRDKYPGIAWPVVTWQPGQSVLFDRPYKTTDARDLHLDIFRPARPLRQGIVLVHGGGWRAGGKSHFYALANLLAQRGYTVFLPEFRLSPEAAYPAGMIDIGDALAWARSHAAEFGLDPRRIAVGGASSGGQMASLLAYAGPSGLFGAGGERTANALIDLDGVLDFTTPQALSFENAAGDASPAARWLGGSYEHAPAKWREASAASHVRKSSPPTLIVSSGIPRFTEGKDAVIAALKRNAIPYRFHAFSNAPHDFWLFDPWLPQVAEQIDSFLASLSSPSEPATR
ncbi:alpha/beta hydrolase [Novosphingobium kaempferiae]|uniref:alpha/beta hydrolase n=1 Tax=Novosphingobium kaempferiae TaxID=2896849 RepID=UPI001E627D26|nr:alpha/beta hydrolase [Novosphingobium kaempferiae]